MRRSLILITVLLLAWGVSFAYDQTKLQELNNQPDYSNDSQAPPATAATPQITEDFEGGVPPAGWSVTDDTGSGIVWEAGPGACGQTNDTNGSGGWALADSDCFGSATYDTSLITESYNFCSSLNSGMTASINYQNFAGYDYFYIDCDQGAGWENLLTWNEDHGSFGSPPGEDVSLDMSGFDGAPSVTCRFRYEDLNNPGWYWWVMVDDFVLVSDGVITTPGVDDCGGGGIPATTGVGLVLLVLALGGSSAYFLRRK
jgi:hypothetical protein